MGIVTVDTKYGPIDVTIGGDEPTPKEIFKLDDIKFNTKNYLPEDVIANYEKTQKGQSLDFDYETGIQDTKLRAMLGRADSKADQEKVLREGFDLLETEYTRDNLGNLALTPEGALKFGVETEKPVLIDERGFTRQDLSDLSGLGTTLVGGVSGALIGQAAIPVPILGAVIGATIGGGAGKAAEEGIEAFQGVQAQTGSEITKDIIKEGLISGAGEGIFGIAGKVFRLASGTSRVGKGVPEERVKDILTADDKGYMLSLGTIGAPSLAARQQAIAEKALGTSKRLRNNHAKIMEDLKWLRGADGEVDVQGAADALTSAAKIGDTKLSSASRVQEKKLLTHMEDIANNLGRAADQDVAITDDLFAAFQQSYKAFDDLVETQFLKINNAIDDTVGDAAIFNTGTISKDALQMSKRFDNAQVGTNPHKAGLVLKEIAQLGKKASFGQLYYARKSLRDTGMFNITSDTIGGVVDDFLPQIDNLLNINSIDTFVAPLLKGPQNAASLKLIREASEDLDKARSFYKRGNKKFESVNSAISKKSLINAVRNDAEINPQQVMRSLIRKNNPKLLQDAEKTIDEFKGAGSFAPLKERLASEWLRDTLSKSTNTKTGSFSGYKFKQKLDEIGSTADELFGTNVKEVKKLAEQLNALSLRNIDQKVIEDFAAAGADDTGINLLRNLAKAQDDQAKFNRNRINKKLASGDLTATEAAEFIADGSMRAEDITSLRKFFENDADAIGKIQTYYMDNLIGDFEKNFLTDKTQFAKFGDRLLKNKAKIQVIYGKEMAAEMDDFGKIMKLLGESTSGGDLVAANIAASPLENLGTIAKLSIIGQLFSSPRFYKAFTNKYKKLSSGENVKTRGQIAGELLKDSLSSLIAQGSLQSFDEAATSAVDQATTLIDEFDKTKASNPKPVSSNQTNIPIPEVSPVFDTSQNQSASLQPPTSVRKRAQDDPQLASILLGGLGNSAFL